MIRLRLKGFGVVGCLGFGVWGVRVVLVGFSWTWMLGFRAVGWFGL